MAQGSFDFLVDRERLRERWNQVAFPFDSESLRLFLNGDLAVTHQLPVKGPAAEFGGVVIGGHRAGTGRNFDGWVDEVAIWQRLLDQDEIRRLSKASSKEKLFAGSVFVIRFHALNAMRRRACQPSARRKTVFVPVRSGS